MLIKQITQEVIQLSQEASQLLAIMQQETSWPAVLSSLQQQWQEDDLDEQAIRVFISQLQEEGWITLRVEFPGEEVHNEF